MALIALNAINHNGLLLAPGQHVDCSPAERERLINLGYAEEQDDKAAEKATKIQRQEKDEADAREAQKLADEAKTAADKLALESKPA